MLGVGRVLRQIRVLERHGLDFGALAVLFTIAHEEGGRRASDVAEQLRLDLSTVSRHVRALQDAGHVTKTTDPADRRAQVLTISPEGADTLHTIMDARGQVFATALSTWSSADQSQLADLLDRLAADLTNVLAPDDTAAPIPGARP
jgi:DNA-binding MarR family transcriptional regulator